MAALLTLCQRARQPADVSQPEVSHAAMPVGLQAERKLGIWVHMAEVHLAGASASRLSMNRTAGACALARANARLRRVTASDPAAASAPSTT